MRNLRKICGAWLLSFAVLLSLVPTALAAEDTYTVKVTAAKTEGLKVGETVTLTAAVTKSGAEISSLEESGLQLWFWADTWADGHADGKTDIELSDNSGNVLSTDVTLNTAGTYYLAAEVKSGDARQAIEFITLTVASEQSDTAPATKPDPVQSDIYVPYIEGTDGDFIRGADVSYVLSILNSGAHYYDWDGKMLGTADNVDSQGEAFMALLKEAGLNWVRLRVWNDPFDANGNGYGGGNTDLEAVKRMGKWASDAGLKVLVDFHYSDFWADPGKQKAPKAWEKYTVDEKTEAIRKFTTDSLNTLLDAGVNVGMVQVGNETTSGICGVSYSTDGWPAACKLYSAGCDAVHTVVRAHDTEILAAVHFTNPEREGSYAEYAKNLAENNVDYDVFASSYYPFWHGTAENLTAVLKNVADTYGKKVIVAETSWPWTSEEGDGHGNTFGGDQTERHPFSEQGQASAFAEVVEAVKAAGSNGAGVFYWDPDQIPVVNISQMTEEEQAAQYPKSKALWEKYGSGWAADCAKEFEEASDWEFVGGGSPIENQALFDFDGKALESLKVFKYVTTGTKGYKVELGTVENFTQTYPFKGTLELPKTATVTNSVGDSVSMPVTWSSASSVDMSKPGEYTIKGTVNGKVGDLTVTDAPTSCVVTVLRENKLSNPGYEDGETGYTLTNWSGSGITNGSDASNRRSGEWCLHYYSSEDFNASAEHDPVELQPGSYEFSLYTQGEKAEGKIYVKDAAGKELGNATYKVVGWDAWQAPTVTFELTAPTTVTLGIELNASAGAWGGIDDWYLGGTESVASDKSPISTAGHWAADAISFASDRDLIPDTDAFSPDAPVTNAMLTTALARMEGVDTSGGATWYEKGMQWAAEKGISDSSDPQQNVARERLVVMVYQYAGSPSTSGKLSGFADADKVSSDALAAVQWAVEQGILTGNTEGTLNPKGLATCAEALTVLMRFCCKAN